MPTIPSRPHLAAHFDSTVGPGRTQTDAEQLLEIVRNIRVDAGLNPVIRFVARQIFELFSCPRIMVAAQETAGERAFLWTARNAPRDLALRLHCATLGRSSPLFNEPSCWFANRRRGSNSRSSIGITYGLHADAASTATWSRRVSSAFAVVQADQSCIAAPFPLGREWACRLFIVDPQINRSRANALRLVEDLVAALGPALCNVYIAERLRTSAADSERANFARALHDGVIQSLIAAEMELHAACRRTNEGTAVTSGELRRIQELLHGEVLGLRDLMQRIKPVNIEPHELREALVECVGKFKADTGIACTLTSDIEQLSLSAAMCPPLVRIVQEALSNVRKHSAARHVAVRIAESRGRWRLVIEDDGRGFDASAAPPSPLVIRECVRALDGDLQVSHAAGGGLRLEIAFSAYTSSTEGAEASARLVALNERVSSALDRAGARAGRGGRIERRATRAMRNAERREPSEEQRGTPAGERPVLGRVQLTRAAR